MTYEISMRYRFGGGKEYFHFILINYGWTEWLNLTNVVPVILVVCWQFQGRTLFGSHYPSWTFCPVSGCCLYGVLSPGGQFSGDDIAWVYPDSRTALVGERESRVAPAQQTTFYPHIWMLNLLWVNIVNLKTHRIYEEIFLGTFQDGKMIEV